MFSIYQNKKVVFAYNFFGKNMEFGKAIIFSSCNQENIMPANPPTGRQYYPYGKLKKSQTVFIIQS